MLSLLILGGFCCRWKAVFILCTVLYFNFVDSYHQAGNLTDNQYVYAYKNVNKTVIRICSLSQIFLIFLSH